MLVKIYAGEIGKTRVNLLDPGIVRTRLRARAVPGEDPSRLPPLDQRRRRLPHPRSPRMRPQRRGGHGLRGFIATE